MKIRSISLALVALLVAGSALAQMGPGAGAKAPRRNAVLAGYLDLTPDQIAAWKLIRSDAVATVKPLAEQVRGDRQDLAALLKTEAPDPAAVGKLVLSAHATRTQIRDARQAAHEKFVALLTPDQKTKLEAFEKAARIIRHRSGGAGPGGR